MIHDDELFGWLFHCVQTRLSVKIHLKTISSTAHTKSWDEKDTYWITKVYFILVLEKLFFFLSSISITSLSCLLMIHGDEIIWMAFALCPNQTFYKNTLENHFQYCSYQKLSWKRHLLNKKSTLHSRTREVGFFFYLQFQSLF